MEFLQNFKDANKDGKISRDVNFYFKFIFFIKWNDYYSAVSASLDNDDHFVEMMKMAWKL